jgi:hypothetical protein
MKTKHFILAITVALLGIATAFPQSQSTNDLWDVSQGVTIIGHSSFDAADVRPDPYDARDIFGGLFSNYTPERDAFGSVVFDDEVPPDFIHHLEWRTTAPVTIRSFNLFATGDNPAQQCREFASFTLKAKSPGSPTYDLTLYTFSPQHPYVFIDPQTYLLVSADIPAVTAQEFRAEFANYPNQGLPGPRILELDAFSVPRAPYVTIAVACVDVCWNSLTNRMYQVQYRSDLTTNMWANLGAPSQGNGTTNCITETVRGEPQRYYRVQELR